MNTKRHKLLIKRGLLPPGTSLKLYKLYRRLARREKALKRMDALMVATRSPAKNPLFDHWRKWHEQTDKLRKRVEQGRKAAYWRLCHSRHPQGRGMKYSTVSQNVTSNPDGTRALLSLVLRHPGLGSFVPSSVEGDEGLNGALRKVSPYLAELGVTEGPEFVMVAMGPCPGGKGIMVDLSTENHPWYVKRLVNEAVRILATLPASVTVEFYKGTSGILDFYSNEESCYKWVP